MSCGRCDQRADVDDILLDRIVEFDGMVLNEDDGVCDPENEVDASVDGEVTSFVDDDSES